MSDRNTAATDEQPRTCRTCSERHYAAKCNRLGWVDFEENDTPDDDGATFADLCFYWKEADPDTLEQRHEQLADVAREMLGCVLGHRYWPLRHKLEALGVRVDD